MNDNYPYGGVDNQRGGYRAHNQGQDENNQNHDRQRDNEGWRGFVEERPWQQAGSHYDEGGGLRNQGRQPWPGQGWDSGDYRSGAPADVRGDYRERSRGLQHNHSQDNRQASYGQRSDGQRNYGQGNYRQDNYRQDNSRQGNWGDHEGAGSERFGQWSSPNQWGRQSYGRPYSQRDWGARNYQEDPVARGEQGGWYEGEENWQGRSPGETAGYGGQRDYDESRSSQGNRRYPGFAGAYTGETQGRQWGAFGGTGWGSTGTDSGVWQGTLAGGHHRGRGPKGYQRADERIKEEICERLAHDPYIDASDISIECRAGVVTLEGSIERRSLKHRVEDMVDAVSGVRDVHNRLTVASTAQALSQPRSGIDDSHTGAGAQEQQATSATTTTGTPAETRSTQHAASGSTTTRQ